MEITIKIFEDAGVFAENKDVAKVLRERKLLPSLLNKKIVVLDFSGVELTTQSFIHALISDPIRRLGHGVLDKIKFKDCNSSVKSIISIVVEYLQRSF